MFQLHVDTKRIQFVEYLGGVLLARLFFLLFCMELRKRNRVKMWSEDNLNRNLILMKPPPKHWIEKMVDAPDSVYQLPVECVSVSPQPNPSYIYELFMTTIKAERDLNTSTRQHVANIVVLLKITVRINLFALMSAVSFSFVNGFNYHGLFN